MEKVCFNCFKPCEGNFCPYCGYEQGSAMNKYTLALPEGSVLNGRYIVGRVLGQGGFGITYAAQDYNTKSLVAIKEFFPDSLVTRTSKVSVSTISADRKENFEYGKECFLKEAETLSQFIDHPNIVTIYSYFEENNTAYLAMEYLDGENFLDYLRRKGKISWEETRKICEPVMDALAFVHSKGLIHRDISPDNIFMCKDGAVKLIDFGAARYSLGDRSQSLSVVLKHGFAPMEQYTRRGRQGPYTDIYALAATMYRAVTGETPPEAHDRMYDDELLPPTSLGADMPDRDEEALLKALAFDYNNRWQTVDDFRSALSQLKEPEPEPEKYETVAVNDEGEKSFEPEKKTSDKTEPKPKKKKKGLIIALVAVLVAVVGIIVGVTVLKNNPASESLGVEVEWDSENRAEFEGITYELQDGEVHVVDADKDITSAEIAGKVNGSAVTKIEYAALANCDNLTILSIPNSVIKIDPDAYGDNDKLSEINVDSDNAEYSSADGNLYNKDKTLLIKYAPGKNDSSFTVPDSVTGINYNAFSYCKKLSTVMLSDNVVDLYTGSFQKFTGLNSITIPDSVTNIGWCVFSGCTSLTSITIPASVTDIGWCAFEYCESLTSVTIPDSVSSIEDSAFVGCASLTSVTIPDSVTSIGYHAFSECNLSEVSVPSGCDVDEDAFDKNVKITYR